METTVLALMLCLLMLYFPTSTDMETTMLALVLCLVMPYFPAEPKTIPLSMMEKSVDDMYVGCSEAMGQRVKDTYFPREKKSDEDFKEAWEGKDTIAQDKFDNSDKKLTKEQIQALYVYTAEFPNVYAPFNAAVRESADSYTTDKFKYYSLHYWLTTALQRLKKNECRTTYRRSNDTFTGKPNDEIRFGQFASTSTRPHLIAFGIETCFQIKTCLGVPIQDYSCYDGEDEVLVPPYETFKISHIAHGSYKKLNDCKHIFVLKNLDKKSNLNCKAVPEDGRKRANIFTSCCG